MEASIQAYSRRDAESHAKCIRNNNEVAVIIQVKSSQPERLQYSAHTIEFVNQIGCSFEVVDVITPAPGTKPGL